MTSQIITATPISAASVLSMTFATPATILIGTG
jgi:hypothetical protein